MSDFHVGSEVREGTVNGLPCFRLYVEGETVLSQISPEYDETMLVPAGPWYAGFPDWWPYPPSERCPECGFVYAEAAQWSIGHVCPGIEQPNDPDKVRVVQHPIEFLTDEDEWERLP